MNFIRLTEKYTNGNEAVIILNVNHIKSFKLADKGVDTHVQMTDAKFYFVKESVDQIWVMLNAKAPVYDQRTGLMVA